MSSDLVPYAPSSHRGHKYGRSSESHASMPLEGPAFVVSRGRSSHKSSRSRREPRKKGYSDAIAPFEEDYLDTVEEEEDDRVNYVEIVPKEDRRPSGRSRNNRDLKKYEDTRFRGHRGNRESDDSMSDESMDDDSMGDDSMSDDLDEDMEREYGQIAPRDHRRHPSGRSNNDEDMETFDEGRSLRHRDDSKYKGDHHRPSGRSLRGGEITKYDEPQLRRRRGHDRSRDKYDTKAMGRVIPIEHNYDDSDSDYDYDYENHHNSHHIILSTRNGIGRPVDFLSPTRPFDIRPYCYLGGGRMDLIDFDFRCESAAGDIQRMVRRDEMKLGHDKKMRDLKLKELELKTEIANENAERKAEDTRKEMVTAYKHDFMLGTVALDRRRWNAKPGFHYRGFERYDD